MSVYCKPVVNDLEFTSDCGCTLVDFDITIKNLCNHSRYGIIAQVFKDRTDTNPGTVVATVCRIFNVYDPEKDLCECIEHTEHFTNVIVDIVCCTNANLTVEILYSNYIIKCAPIAG